MSVPDLSALLIDAGPFIAGTHTFFGYRVERDDRRGTDVGALDKMPEHHEPEEDDRQFDQSPYHSGIQQKVKIFLILTRNSDIVK